MTTFLDDGVRSRAGKCGASRLALWLCAALLLAVGAPEASGALLTSDETDIPDVGEPFDVKAFEAYSLPAGKNADSLYLLAQRSLVKLDHKRAAFARSEAAEKSARQAALLGWGEANDDVRKWLDANEKALGAWKSGTMWAEAIEVPLRELNFESDLPVSNDARTFVKLALAKASQLTHEEQTAEAWTWYRATLRASRHLGMRGGVVERMVGADVYRLARDPILNWAACTQVSAADLRQALDDIVAIDSMTAPLSRSLKVEYLGVRHSINLVLTNLRKEHPFVAVAIRQSGRPEQMMRVANLYFANWLANADRPRSQRRPRIDKEVGLFEPAPGSPRLPPPRVLKKLIAMQLSGLEPNMGVIKSPIVDYALPGMMFLFDTVDQDQVNRAAVITGLALQLYLRDHGRFPQAVSELVSARYLKILPRDPYGNGESIHYRLESKPPERAVVWSVGLGGISEAGELPAAKGDDRSTSDTVFEITAARQSPLSTK